MLTLFHYLFPFLPTTMTAGLALFLKISAAVTILAGACVVVKFRAVMHALDTIKPILTTEPALLAFTLLRVGLYLFGFGSITLLLYSAFASTPNVDVYTKFTHLHYVAFAPYILQIGVSMFLTKQLVMRFPVVIWTLLILTVLYTVPIARVALTYLPR